MKGVSRRSSCVIKAFTHRWGAPSVVFRGVSVRLLLPLQFLHKKPIRGVFHLKPRNRGSCAGHGDKARGGALRGMRRAASFAMRSAKSISAAACTPSLLMACASAAVPWLGNRKASRCFRVAKQDMACTHLHFVRSHLLLNTAGAKETL